MTCLRHTFFFIIPVTILLSCSHPHYKDPHILINTNYGEIELELYPEKAPKTVAAFLSYIDSGYYSNSAFYRVIKDKDLLPIDNYGLIQGGVWQTDDKPGPQVKGIVHESTKLTGLSHTSGTISLARTAPGTASTEFFICIDDQTQFNYGNEINGDKEGYAAFGKVLKGMKVVREIQSLPSNGDRFIEPVKISAIKRL